MDTINIIIESFFAILVFGPFGIIAYKIISKFVNNSSRNNTDSKVTENYDLKKEKPIFVDSNYILIIEKLNSCIESINENIDIYIDANYADQIKKELGELIDETEAYKPNKKFPDYETVLLAKNLYKDFESKIKERNNIFVQREKLLCKELFIIDKKELDDQQKTAVVTDELHNLVIAGAGSGKTLTIAGKVKYLCERKNISHEEILLVSFTRKAAEEMNERINKNMGLDVDAVTFHKLGINIITDITGEFPDVYDDLEGFVSKEIYNQVEKDDNMMDMLIEFFAYYISLIEEPTEYETYGDYISAMKNSELESLKSKYIKAIQKDELRSLYGEKVKSVQEVIIANFFFLNGIKYDYEREYPYRNNYRRKKYKPDFYLPDYDIYWEHFSVDKNQKCHLNSDSSKNRKYEEDMKWKRRYHEINGTSLIESYAYYGYDGNLLRMLEKICDDNNIERKPINRRKLFETVYIKNRERVFNDFTKLVSSFIKLSKANGYDKEKFDELIEEADRIYSDFEQKRTKLFLSIVARIFEEYETYLIKSKKIDFSDMILKASNHIENSNYKLPYKYVIIDEYQDIGMDRYKLVKAILNNTGAKLMCVGDDWQSIYRFAGSDISLFTKFQDYWGKSEILFIEKTYRNSQQLIDIAGGFVMSNYEQIKKNLKSDKTCLDPINAIYMDLEDPEPLAFALKKALDEIISIDGVKTSILLLGRTNYDLDALTSENEESPNYFKVNKKSDSVKIVYSEAPKMKISFLTVHKAKGTEADNVVLLNVRDDLLGFPNKITDDPLLRYVLSDTSDYMYAEERRLFYVALTRTKNRVYLLLKPHAESIFYHEIEENVAGSIVKDKRHMKCPICKRGDIVARINRNTGSKFYGCSNYPYCEYTDNSIMTNTNDSEKEEEGIKEYLKFIDDKNKIEFCGEQDSKVIGKTKTGKTKKGKAEFFLLKEEADRFVYTDFSYITNIREEMNRVCRRDNVKKLVNDKLTEILLNKGLIMVENLEGKNNKAPTEKGLELGIKVIHKVKGNGEAYTLLMYPESVQRMLVECLINKENF